jgi:hypothetical protein
MPTKPVLPITELDFFQAKNQLKEFLRNDPSGRFRDIDFEGSNMSVLLDVLSYNTYQNNFYTNMAISEMFLDSAQLENSVVSHAKELNYLPRSAKSAKAVVNIEISDPLNTDSTIIIPETTLFTSDQQGERFNFFTDREYTARKVGSLYIANGVEIFEGEALEEAFIVTGRRQTIRLLNQNIDISSIKVFENFDEPLDRIEYIFKNDIFGVSSEEPVFYIEPSFDQTYEIVFGKNRFGRMPPNDTEIRVLYRTANGEAPNGACRFRTTFRQSAERITISTVENARGGAEKETLEDIKFFAPRSIQVQERAVTTKDYEILLKQRFNEIQDVSVFGGDELDPPQFGKVAIAVNIDGGLSEVSASDFRKYLADKTPVSIEPIIIPPKFLYVQLDINVSYFSNKISESENSIENDIRLALKEYRVKNLNKFGSVFEISRVGSIIDSTNSAIKNNTIDAIPYILYSPEFNRKENPTFDFGQTIDTPFGLVSSANRRERYERFISSSIFRFDGSNAIFEDDGLGNINILNARERDSGIIDVIRKNAGVVDYEKGIVKLSDFVVDFYDGRGIKIFAKTREKNVTAPKTRVLILEDFDVTININEVTK